MAAATLALEQWNVEYHETMAAAAKVRLAVQAGANYIRLMMHFRQVSKDFDELLSLLARLEALPSPVLLQGEAQEIPQALRVLFRHTCGLLEASAAKGLTGAFLLGDSIARVNHSNQKVAEYADRLEAAQQKLRTFIAKDQVPQYMASLRAYHQSELNSDVASDEDIKDITLHF